MVDIQKFRDQISTVANTLDLPPFVEKVNELVSQQAWEQAAIEEKLAAQKIADMWKVVQTVATQPSTYYDDNLGWYECPFCNGGDDRNQTDEIKHEANCIVIKARNLVRAPEQGA